MLVEEFAAMHHALTIALTLSSVLFAAAAAGGAPADRELIREGIALHDAGALRGGDRVLPAGAAGGTPRRARALRAGQHLREAARPLRRDCQEALAERGELGANLHSLLGS